VWRREGLCSRAGNQILVTRTRQSLALHYRTFTYIHLYTVRGGSWSYSKRRDRNPRNGCCTAMWKSLGKTSALLLCMDSLFSQTATKAVFFFWRSWLLKHVTEEDIERKIEVTRRRRRRHKQTLEDFAEERRYCKMKEKALDRTLFRTGFGRGYGPAVRKNGWINKRQKLLIAIMQDDLVVNVTYCHVALHCTLGLGSLTAEVYSSHTIRYAFYSIPLDVRSARDRGHYLHNTQQIETNVHAVSGIKTGNSSN
jgi:hypothetical protein